MTGKCLSGIHTSQLISEVFSVSVIEQQHVEFYSFVINCFQVEFDVLIVDAG